MKKHLADEEIELPGDITARIIAFDDGAIRLSLNASPYVLAECVVGDPVDAETIVTLSPGQQGSAAMTGKIKPSD